jgi:hypothetical protein
VTKVLLRATAVAAAVALGGTFVVAQRLDQQGLWLATTAVGLGMLLVSLPAVLWVLPRLKTSTADTLPMLASLVVVASMLKALAAAVGVLVLVEFLNQPTWITFGFLATWYVLLTVTLASITGVAFWRRDAAVDVETDAAGSKVAAPPR